MIINPQFIGLNKHTAKEDYIEWFATRGGENIVLRPRKREEAIKLLAMDP